MFYRTTNWFTHSRHLIAMASISLALACVSAGLAQVVEDGDWPSPLMDEEPFDVVYLNDKCDNAIMKIVPPDNLKRPFPRDGVLRFEFREDSEFILQVPYEFIEEYVPYSTLLLEEAEQFLDERDYAAALRNLLYVYDNGGASDPDVKRKLQSCLYKDAAANLEDGNFELALSIFEDLYQKNPGLKVRGVSDSMQEVIQRCYDALLQQRFENGDAEYIKSTLVNIEAQYGEVLGDFVAGWRQRFADQAKQVLRDARQGSGRW